jgi:hypothetical protein
MSQHDDRTRLTHMLDAARQAVAFTSGRTRADLDQDLQLALALTRLVEIVGEAANNVAPDTRERLPQVPGERSRVRVTAWSTLLRRGPRSHLADRNGGPSRSDSRDRCHCRNLNIFRLFRSSDHATDGADGEIGLLFPYPADVHLQGFP